MGIRNSLRNSSLIQVIESKSLFFEETAKEKSPIYLVCPYTTLSGNDWSNGYGNGEGKDIWRCRQVFCVGWTQTGTCFQQTSKVKGMTAFYVQCHLQDVPSTMDRSNKMDPKKRRGGKRGVSGEGVRSHAQKLLKRVWYFLNPVLVVAQKAAGEWTLLEKVIFKWPNTYY